MNTSTTESPGGTIPKDLFKQISMRKIILIFLLLFTLTQTFGQSQRKLSTYLLTQYNNTIYDRTAGNNPWGMGLGLQTFLNNKTKFKPTIELTADIYLEDDKVFRINPNGTEINDFRGMINLFVGTSFHPTQTIYLFFLTGPSFIGGQTLLGIKPSFGFYFTEKQRWTGKLSYINIFSRDKMTKEDFGSISLAIGFKLF